MGDTRSDQTGSLGKRTPAISMSVMECPNQVMRKGVSDSKIRASVGTDAGACFGLANSLLSNHRSTECDPAIGDHEDRRRYS